MRLGGRLSAAIEVLDDITRRHRPAGEALRDWGLSHRFAGAGDRAAIGNIVYDALRRRRSASWLLDDDTPRALGLGALVLEWGMDGDAIDSALAEDRFAPALLDEGERASLAGRDLGEAPEAVRADCPDWCAPLMRQSLGEDWVAEAKGLAARPPLDLRVNTLLASSEKVVSELSRTGAAAMRLAPDGLRVAPIEGAGRHPNVQAEPAYRKGWFEVQDEGSQIVAELAGARPGMQVLDLCAGAGGKTLAMAAMMENKGQIFAHDAEKARLAPIFDRLKRAGARNVQTISHAQGLRELDGRMDMVLVDAPCTGSGTWRRRPDAKWRLTSRQLDVRQKEQAAILNDAAALVKPGGRLVYITCSVFAEENRDRIADFLARNEDFAAADHRAIWDARIGRGDDSVRIEGRDGIVLTPARSGTDGFYFAALERRA